MKSLIFATFMLAGTAAFAQGGQPVAPGNNAPERDARGIPVISDPAQAPPGTNQMLQVAPGSVYVPNPNQAAAFAPQPATETYQACSRTVTDNCVQTYEGGSRRARRRGR
jgi:hypothetical protein